MIRAVALVISMTVYIGLVMVPGEWLWFDPGQPVIEDAVVGADPVVRFSREIKRKTIMRYSVLLRRDQSDEPACDAQGGPFTYLPSRSGVLLDWTLGRLTPSDPRCAALPAGAYYGSVTWTITNPYRDLLPQWSQPIFGGLMAIIPPKEITRDIPVFTIAEAGA